MKYSDRALSSPVQSRIRLVGNWVKYLFYLLPVLLVVMIIEQFSVDVPLMDSFALVELFHKVHLGEVGFIDFWKTHNEHRILFPKLVAVSLGFFTNWSFRVEQYFSLGLALLSFVLLCHLSRRSPPKPFHFYNIITGCLFFSILQYENWLWGFQIAWFAINLFLILAVCLLSDDSQTPNLQNLDRNFLIAALFCGLASFSSAHGLLVWLAVFPCVWVKSQAARNPKLQQVIWLILFGLSTFLYSSNYEEPANTLSRTYFLEHPLAGLKFGLVLIGRSLSPDILFAIIWGIILSISCSICLHLFLHDRDRRHLIAPWLSLMLFAGLFVAMVTVGRTVLGIAGALASRYTTVTLLIPIGIVQIGRIYAQRQVTRIAYFMMAVLIVAFINSSQQAFAETQNLYQQRTLGQTCFPIVRYLEESSHNCLLSVYPGVTPIQAKWAPMLEDLGFYDFVRDAQFVRNPADIHGLIEQPTSDAPIILKLGEVLSLNGWAILPSRSSTPQLVLFSQGDRETFFAATFVNRESPDVAQVLGKPEFDRARWQTHLLAESFPPGKTTIWAWAYDEEHQKFLRLLNSIQVRRLPSKSNS